MLIDLYLYNIFNTQTLYKLSGLKLEEAKQYAHRWFEMNDAHDYMLVTQGSTPWVEKPNIIDITPDWIDDQYKLLNEKREND